MKIKHDFIYNSEIIHWIHSVQFDKFHLRESHNQNRKVIGDFLKHGSHGLL